GEIGAGAGLGEALAPDLLAAQDRLQEALLLPFRPVVDERRAGQTRSDADVDHLRGAGRDVLLVEDQVLERRQVAAAVLARPGESRPPAVVELALPAPRERDLVRRRLGPGRRILPLGRHVRAQPVADRRAERLFLAGAKEVHAGKRSALGARPAERAALRAGRAQAPVAASLAWIPSSSTRRSRSSAY